MDKRIASYVLAGLIERIQAGQIGTVTRPEREALDFVMTLLTDTKVAASVLSLAPEVSLLASSPVVTADAKAPDSVEPTVLLANGVDIAGPAQAGTAPAVSLLVTIPVPTIELNLDSLDLAAPTDPDVLLCLDFGTAMSKAFASLAPDSYLDLQLGRAAGGSGYTLPSSVFIANDGKVYFGAEAIEQSEELMEGGRERLDSIKTWISLRNEGNLDSELALLKPAYNPTPFKLTEGDLIRIYLAYLTDTVGDCLWGYKTDSGRINRYAKRRFARPCWKTEKQTEWADRLMRTWLAEAQILADTFAGQWLGGIDAGVLKEAVNQVRALGRRPDYLIAEGIPEPMAVAGEAMEGSDNFRDPFMVVDVGAGTTDFGLFVVTHNQELDKKRVFQLSASILGLNQAGDKVDGLLRTFIRSKEGFDANDASGKQIEADLRRRIRGLKEQLFKTGNLEYTLADDTVGLITLDEFLANPMVKQFAAAVEGGFQKSLEAVDPTWLQWLAMDGVRLKVVLTGGSSELPMMQALAHGLIEVKGFKILREPAKSVPEWVSEVSGDFLSVYPQLAVAIGGSAEELPHPTIGPVKFAGGTPRVAYVVSK